MEEESWFEGEAQVEMGLGFSSRGTGPARESIHTDKEQDATGSLSVIRI